MAACSRIDKCGIRRIWSCERINARRKRDFSVLPQEVICVRLILETRHGIIRETDDHHLALRILPAPDVHPKIESVVQVNIREER